MSDHWSRPRRLRTVSLPEDNVDTDQIIPARYLTTTTRGRLGTALFADRRGGGGVFDPEAARAAGAEALMTGANFGCGSSREHAVWALQQGGFRAVLARSLADIFRRNALENGLLAIEISDALRDTLARSGGPVLIDLRAQTVAGGDLRERFDIDPFARYRLLRQMRTMDFLLRHEGDVAAYEQDHHEDGGRA